MLWEYNIVVIIVIILYVQYYDFLSLSNHVCREQYSTFHVQVQVQVYV